MKNQNDQLIMNGPSYNWLKDTLEPTPKPKPGKRYDDEFPEEVSALLQLLEEELQKALSKGDEVEFTPDLTMALDRLNALEKMFASDPRMHYLACLLRAKIDEIMATYNHKPIENKEAAEEEENNLSIVPAPTPLSMVPEPKSTSEKEKEKEEENENNEEEGLLELLEKQLKPQDPKDVEPEQDKGYVPPYSRF